ncbi:hypothetical protein EUGRSUZ_H01283 [Eucalyptus grandis]|uniref:Uncharacterized protein n=2 Tax=Eucalyptus grandis TaxID=71139 RepID=A0ACC3JQM6_EUCGR|nr:hypothetical protein EUGRSUZ_H01283 [Eucalyptus grandis]
MEGHLEFTRKIDHGQDHVISPQTLDQPKPRIDHLLQPSIPTSSPPTAKFTKIPASTQCDASASGQFLVLRVPQEPHGELRWPHRRRVWCVHADRG